MKERMKERQQEKKSSQFIFCLTQGRDGRDRWPTLSSLNDALCVWRQVRMSIFLVRTTNSEDGAVILFFITSTRWTWRNQKGFVTTPSKSFLAFFPPSASSFTAITLTSFSIETQWCRKKRKEGRKKERKKKRREWNSVIIESFSLSLFLSLYNAYCLFVCLSE